MTDMPGNRASFVLSLHRYDFVMGSIIWAVSIVFILVHEFNYTQGTIKRPHPDRKEAFHSNP